MKIVVDTNIVFSAVLNSDGLIGELLFNSESQLEFFSTEFMIEELTKYKARIASMTTMSVEQVEISINQVLKKMTLIAPEAIAEKYWHEAFAITAGIDQDDSPFIAAALSLKASLWTGDKKLVRGLKS